MVLRWADSAPFGGGLSRVPRCLRRPCREGGDWPIIAVQVDQPVEQVRLVPLRLRDGAPAARVVVDGAIVMPCSDSTAQIGSTPNLDL